MALHYRRDGYTFQADFRCLTIEPGPRPIRLERWELERLGLAIREDYRLPVAEEGDSRPRVAAILSSLAEALKRLEGPAHARARRDVRSAMDLIGRLDEQQIGRLLDGR